MFGKTLLLGAIVGGIVYALLKTQNKITEERADMRDASSRWEDEGGAPAPTEGAAAAI